ncbi:MAG TPA: Ig-like domain-containing protein [Planctomycetota bacterium]
MHVARTVPGALCIALLAAACWNRTPAPAAFEVVRTSPSLGSESEPILLNDSITIYFSDTLQALSVTPDSVSLVDEEDRPVRGALRVGSNWVAFQPEPPLTPELTDGALRPGGTCRLFVAGYPRHDAVRANDGRRLAAAVAFQVRVAGLGYKPPGLPAPLRPPPTELPFVLRNQDPPLQTLPADAPRIRLRFTVPVLPSTAVAEAFDILLLRNPLETLVPRSVRVVPSRLPEDFPGSTVEIDLGGMTRPDGTGPVSLKPTDLISVGLKTGPHALRDYAGNVSLPALPWYWSVAKGASIALAEWSPDDGAIVEGDPLTPGFEVRAGAMRPRVRVEAGDGSLGVFRPQRDTTLRPGEPFDRGDGHIVTSRGGVFPFLAVDIPAGRSVVVDARAGPVQILSCADLRIAGSVELLGTAQPMQGRFLQVLPVRDLLESSPVSMVAAGDVHISGSVTAATPVQAENTLLTLATAARMQLNGALPFNTILALEVEGPAVRGVLGQTTVVWSTFTYGLARGAAFTASGFTGWRQFPWDRDGGVVRILDADPELKIGWQTTPADLHRRREPDLRRSLARSQPIADQDRIGVEPGAFVRFELTASLRDRQPLPKVRDLRIVER